MARTPAPKPAVHPASANWVHREFLAQFLRLEPETLDRLSREGVAKRATERGYFLFRETVGDYVEHLRKVAASHSSRDGEFDVAAESAQLKRIQRLRHEQAMARDAGDLLPASAAAAVYGELVADVRTAILGIPARVQGELPHMVASEVEAVKRCCRETLDELKALGEKPPRIGAT